MNKQERQEHLDRIQERILSDGIEETLTMIKSQNIKGPTFEEMFGKKLSISVNNEV